MEAIREVLEVTDHTVTVRLPESFKASRVEVIVLPLPHSVGAEVGGIDTAPVRRTPSPRLAGTHILGDLSVPAQPPEDWNVLR